MPPVHPDLVRGVATYALELFTAAGDLDAVYVPTGMGSVACGLITVRDLVGLRTAVVGVVAAGADRVLEVRDEATAAAMRLLHRTTHNLAEPAGAIALACLLTDRDRRCGGRVAVVLTGGNVDAGVAAAVLAGTGSSVS